LAVRCNTDRINYAYATYHGRLGKTKDDSHTLTEINKISAAWRWECILCFACTFRDVNTTDGILTWAKGAMNYGINN